MITFLPTPDFAESAAMLDSKRLGNQRVEARMILRWLRNPDDYPRQQNAGYTIMWRGYEDALCMYYNACCEEWGRRGGQVSHCQLPQCLIMLLLVIAVLIHLLCIMLVAEHRLSTGGGR